MDIKDAFLTVPQDTDLVAKLPGFENRHMYFAKCIPGQRDGTSRWHAWFMQHLRMRGEVEVSSTCPALFRIKNTSMSVGIVHVDDALLFGRRSDLEVLLAKLKEVFEVSHTFASSPGDCFEFLKRKYVILECGVQVSSHESYVPKLMGLMGVKAGQTSSTPCSKDIYKHDTSPELDAQQAGVYRSAVGLLMYMSSDRIDVCFTVRQLAQRLKKPTVLCWQNLRKLTKYLSGTQDLSTVVDAGSFQEEATKFSSPVHTAECMSEFHLECYSDADWSGSKQNRKSMSCGAIYMVTRHGSTCPHATVRTQKVVSLSSCESELYACSTSVCDSLYLRYCTEFALGEPVSLKLRTGSASCKELLQRSGPTGRLRHIHGRLLFLQQFKQEKLLGVAHVAGNLNVADIGMFAHGFSAHAEAVGRSEWEATVSRHQQQAMVRRIANAGKSPGMQKLVPLLLSMLMVPADGVGSESIVSSAGAENLQGAVSVAVPEQKFRMNMICIASLGLTVLCMVWLWARLRLLSKQLSESYVFHNLKCRSCRASVSTTACTSRTKVRSTT